MFQELLGGLVEGLGKNFSQEIHQSAQRTLRKAKKKMFSFVLEMVLLGCAAVFLLLGLVLFLANFLAIEYVLIIIGASLFAAMLTIGSRSG